MFITKYAYIYISIFFIFNLVNITISKQLSENIMEDNIEPNSQEYNCKNDDCEINNMICDEDDNTKCFCKTGYLTIKLFGKKCGVHKDKRFIAFLLDLLLGFGVGRFVIGDYTIGGIKLFLYIIGIPLLFPLIKKELSDCCERGGMIYMTTIIFFLYSLCLLIIYIVEILIYWNII